MNDPFYNRAGDAPTSNSQPSPAWWSAQRGGSTAAMNYLGGGALDGEVSGYMWNTLGIRDWIVNGGHATDDWIMSSCLPGEFFVFPFIYLVLAGAIGEEGCSMRRLGHVKDEGSVC